MKERPILFNDQMVRAILEGRKTVTRRVMKPQPTPSKSGGHHWPCNVHQSMLHVERELQNGEGCWCGLAEAACPYGKPGDRLWVRETFADIGCRLTFRADLEDGAHCSVTRWTPSLHMPRWASRILLEITAVRVERLQDISEEQARAEGYPAERECETGGSGLDAWLWFRSLWGEINGPEAFTANPWVWVIEFKRVTP
ncbi:hypothetical protein [Pseudomonas aeruginosa]|uniref:hypothetical protein n=1 Tax=Pseudomonas aeruginosa TaxID=287 RepID=UPI003D9C3539